MNLHMHIGIKMKVKYFLRGLGTGIIFATVILMLAGNRNKAMSDDEVMARAEQLGMVQKDALDKALEDIKSTKTPTVTTEAAVTSKPAVHATDKPVVSKEPGNKANGNGAGSASETKAPVKTEIPKTKAPTSEPTVTPKKKDTSEKKYVTVTISAGMWSEEIAAHLYKLGLVKNAKEFDKFLCDNGYGDDIKIGVYEIPKDSSYKEIANIITK